MAKRSLHIGLNYEGSEYALPDCHLDAEAMRGLAEKSGYWADRQHNMSVFRFENFIGDLATQATTKDTTLITFSGHGTQWFGGEEKDRREEGLCFWDGAEIQVLPDNDFLKMVDRIPGTVFIVLDSCFSGGIPRRLKGRPKLSGQWRGKWIPDGEGLKIVRPTSTAKRDQHQPNRLYYMLACKEGEVSWSTGEGGLFTKNFCQAYHAINALPTFSTRYRRNISNVMRETKKMCVPDQTPIYEAVDGNGSRKIF